MILGVTFDVCLDLDGKGPNRYSMAKAELLAFIFGLLAITGLNIEVIYFLDWEMLYGSN
jgi:hypothetical protein